MTALCDRNVGKSNKVSNRLAFQVITTAFMAIAVLLGDRHSFPRLFIIMHDIGSFFGDSNICIHYYYDAPNSWMKFRRFR